MRAKARPRSSKDPRYDLVLRGGRVVDMAQGFDGPADVGIKDGKIAAVAGHIEKGTETKAIDVRGKLVLPGLIDTHTHIYEYVSGTFGLNPDLVGIHSGVTTVVDQGGASALTFLGFRKFIAEPATTRVYSFISAYLVGGLMGHPYPALYGPDQVNVGATVKAIEENRDLVKGIKAHAEIGGYSRWGLEVVKLAKRESRAANLPLYLHTGRLWREAEGSNEDPDRIIGETLPLLDPGDVLAHPFTRHPGGFVSRDGTVHPFLLEAVKKGIRIDVGRGSHFSFAAARKVLEAGILPFTLGADLHGKNLGRAEDGRRIARFNLCHAMNELMALGVPLVEVIKMVTCNAATLLRLEDEIGTLRAGVAADVSVLELETGRWTLEDESGVKVTTTKRLRPRFALRAGTVYPSVSSLIPEPLASGA